MKSPMVPLRGSRGVGPNGLCIPRPSPNRVLGIVSDTPLGSQGTILVRIWSCHHQPPVRTHLQLSRGTRAPGEMTRVPAPPPTGIFTRPSPARHFTKALCPAESWTPILEKFQEKNQRQRLNRRALVTLAGRGRNLSGGSGNPGCLFQDLSQGREERDPWEIDTVVLLKEELVCS